MAFTFFFRDTHTIEHIAKYLEPQVAGRSRVRIWDAGCANGPEPYTLAIILAENMGNFAFKNVYINATDIDESGNFGEIIKNGIYTYDELSRIPEDIFKKYFSQMTENVKGNYKLNDTIISKVSYQKHDLLGLQPIGDSFSLILCKNVLLHFKYEERVEVIKMFHKSLAPDGLFATEQTQKMPEETAHLFEQVVNDAQLFRKIG